VQNWDFGVLPSLAIDAGSAVDSEVIFIGNDKYGRFGTRSWQKYTEYVIGEIPFAWLFEIAYDSGLKLIRRETIEGSPTCYGKGAVSGAKDGSGQGLDFFWVAQLRPGGTI